MVLSVKKKIVKWRCWKADWKLRRGSRGQYLPRPRVHDQNTIVNNFHNEKAKFSYPISSNYRQEIQDTYSCTLYPGLRALNGKVQLPRTEGLLLSNPPGRDERQPLVLLFLPCPSCAQPRYLTSSPPMVLWRIRWPVKGMSRGAAVTAHRRRVGSPGPEAGEGDGLTCPWRGCLTIWVGLCCFKTQCR